MALPFLFMIYNGYLAKTEASQKLQEISDMIWIAKLTFCGGDFRNPFMPDDTMP